jgi:hypothetical protein
MKIVFICKADYYLLFRKIAGALKERFGVVPIAVTFNTKTARILEGSDFSSVYNFTDFMKSKRAEYQDVARITSELKALDMDIGGDVLPRAMSIDRVLFHTSAGTIYRKRRQYSYDEVLKIMYGSYQFWHAIFLKEKPDIVIGETGNVSEYLAWYMARNFKCRYLSLVSTRILDRFFISDNPVERIIKLEKAYAELNSRELVEEERSEVSRILDTFIEKKSKPKNFTHRNPFLFDYERIIKIAKDAISRSLVRGDKADWLYKLEDKDDLSFFSLIPHRIIKAVRHAVATPLFEESPGGDYFFFALHVQPEISTLVFAPYYDNQMAVIENIAKSLPVGYKLAVKEHPNMMGRRQQQFYKELKDFPNVVLISPYIDSHDLTENSSGIITITGTVGLEAALYGKPVIMLGDAFFACYDLTYKATDFKELPALLKKALVEFRPDRDQVLKFLAAIIRSSYRGDILDPVESAYILSEDNIKLIAEAIIAESKELLTG